MTIIIITIIIFNKNNFSIQEVYSLWDGACLTKTYRKKKKVISYINLIKRKHKTE